MNYHAPLTKAFNLSYVIFIENNTVLVVSWNLFYKNKCIQIKRKINKFMIY
jgi:hypothetical protein